MPLRHKNLKQKNGAPKALRIYRIWHPNYFHKNIDENVTNNQKLDLSLIGIYKNIGPTLSIAIITVIFYLLSYSYYSSFFKRLSLPYKGLDLPLTFFISDVVRFVIFAFVLYFAAKAAVEFSSRFKINLKIFKKNAIILGLNTLTMIIAATTLLNTMLPYLNITPIENPLQNSRLLEYAFANLYIFSFVFIIFGLLLSLIIGLLIGNLGLGKLSLLFDSTNVINITCILILIFVVIPYIEIYGQNDAEKLIEGGKGSIEVIITPDEDNTLLKGPYMLVMIKDGNYYFLSSP